MSPLPHPVTFFAVSGGGGSSWAPNASSGLFDAADDYLEGSTTLLNFDPSDSWSVSLWLRTDTISQHCYLVAKIDPGGSNRGWGVGLYQNKPIMCMIQDLPSGWQFERGGNSPYISTGAWHHLCFVYTGSGSPAITDMRMYVDGVECPAYTNYATSLVGPTSSAGALTIGAEIIAKGSAFYGGQLDEVSVFSVALSGGDVATIFNLQSYVQGKADDITGMGGIESLWQMGDQPGDTFAAAGTIHDVMANNDLTCYNTVVGNKVADNASEFTDHTSVALDGIDDYAAAQNPLIVDHNVAFSVSAWFNTSAPSYACLISKQVNWGTYRGWNLFLHATGELRLEMTNTGANYLDVYTLGNQYADGNWHHVLCTVDGSGTAAGVAMYVDGSPVALTTLSDTLAGNTLLNAENLQLGARGSFLADMYFPGELDEVSVYSAALSSGDATAIYNAGTPLDVSTLAASWASIHSWWRMGDGASDTAATLGTISAGGTPSDNLECSNMADTAIVLDTPP